MGSRRNPHLIWVVSLLLLFAPGLTSNAQEVMIPDRLNYKLRSEIADWDRFARSPSVADRAHVFMDVGRLIVRTKNWGWLSDYADITGFPNSQGTSYPYFWNSALSFSIGAGPWFPTPQVHENWTHPVYEADWEARDGARGQLHSNPPDYARNFPLFAISTLPGTWPSTGWPAPESEADVWSGTDTWYKWERIADQESYCEFGDHLADRAGGGQSAPMGIEVAQRALAYTAMDIVFLQLEFSNTSSNNYTDCFVGVIVDRGNPAAPWPFPVMGAYLEYDPTRQLIWARAKNFEDTNDGTHRRDDTGESLSFVGEMFIETPGGSFKESPYDPEQPGANYISDPSSILSRVALLDYDDRLTTNTEETAIYGAITGDVSLMGPTDAENIWKVSQGGGSPVFLQNSQHYKAYNTSWQTDADPFYLASAGPFSFPAGSTVDLVMAYVAGFTEPQMLESADRAIHTYNLKFAGPAPPAAPGDLKANGIQAGPAGREYDSRIHQYPIYYSPSGNITLTWDSSLSMTTPDPSSGVNDFEGIRIYKSMDRGEIWGSIITGNQGSFAGYVPERQWDLENGITGSERLGYTHLGDDTGLVTSWTDTNVLDGIEYWYAITAYDPGEYQGSQQVLRSLESPRGNNPGSLTVIAVITGSRPNGWIAGAIDGDTSTSLDPVVSGPIDTDGSVTVSVVSEAEIVDGTYRITTIDSGSYGLVNRTNIIGVNLENVTTGQVLFTSLLPEDSAYGSGLLPVIDGFKVDMNTLFNGTDPYDRLTVDVPAGMHFYTGWGGENGCFFDGELFMGSTIDVDDVNEASTEFFPAEIRFSETTTQNAYVHYRGAVAPRSSYDQYDYRDVPFTVWDVTDPANPVQKNATITNNSGNTTNGSAFDLGTDAFADDTRHYLSILSSDYSGATADTAYVWDAVTPGSMSSWYDQDHVYGFAPISVDAGLTITDFEGTTLSIDHQIPIGVGWQYEFSTTAPVIEDSLLDLDDIKVVPNPYYIYADWDQSENRRKIQFTNVPMNSEVYIYTLTGELVAVLDHHGDATATTGEKGYNSNRIGTVDWNLWTYEFTEAAYGLYIYVVKTDDGKTKVGKFAIIR